VITQLSLLFSFLRCRLHDMRSSDEQGSVVETVVITAVFAALAITIGAIIVAKITAKANSVDLN
jgi:hypothetical protein